MVFNFNSFARVYIRRPSQESVYLYLMALEAAGRVGNSPGGVRGENKYTHMKPAVADVVVVVKSYREKHYFISRDSGNCSARSIKLNAQYALRPLNFDLP